MGEKCSNVILPIFCLYIFCSFMGSSKKETRILGGGLKKTLYFAPLPRKMAYMILLTFSSGLKPPTRIHPRNLTWIPKMAIFKRSHLLQTIILDMISMLVFGGFTCLKQILYFSTTLRLLLPSSCRPIRVLCTLVHTMFRCCSCLIKLNGSCECLVEKTACWCLKLHENHGS